MALVHVPRSLAALFPEIPRQLEVPADDLAGLIRELDARYPGMWDRLCEPGPRLRRHINAFVDGKPATIDARLGPTSVVHIIPAVSGGAAAEGGSGEPERVHIETIDAWRAWLAEHHARPNGVWLVQWKKHTGRPRVGYEEVVEEALCWGWIDSKAGTVDGDREMLWYSPRRKGSGWSRPNKVRIERLEKQGRMHPAGRAVIEQAKADGSWTLLDAVEDLIVPDDLAAAFEAHAGAREHWEAFPRSAKRALLEWVVTAKRPDTRRKRIEAIAEHAQRGERANQWTRR